jgi:hypothetical protein
MFFVPKNIDPTRLDKVGIMIRYIPLRKNNLSFPEAPDLGHHDKIYDFLTSQSIKNIEILELKNTGTKFFFHKQ